MLDAIKRFVPRRVRRVVGQYLHVLASELNYLEFHLTDHCNLNCKGCTHYSPIAPEKFADPGAVERDLRRIAQLFRGVDQVRLMGGEPLLHPDADRFIRVTRSALPDSRIRFVTNGLLLHRAPDAFWRACRDTGTMIELSVYPPALDHLKEIRALCEAERIPLREKSGSTFLAHGNLSGDSSKRRAFRSCPDRLLCNFLYEGRLYPCSIPPLVHYFNDRFDHEIATAKGVDIHSRFMTGPLALLILKRPMATCRWCAYGSTSFEWQASDRTAAEWSGV